MPKELNPLLAFVDCETTGTDTKKNSIWQFSMRVYNGGRIISDFRANAAPFENDPYKPEVLASIGIDVEAIKNFPAQADFVRKLEQELETLVDPYNKEDKLFLVAYSAVFDYDFLRSTFVRLRNRYFGSYFWYPPICAMQLSAAFFMNVRHTLDNFRLGYVYEMVTGKKADTERLHDADYDLELLIGLYAALDPDYFKRNLGGSYGPEEDIPF